MFQFFRSLMPRDEHFVARLTTHAHQVVNGAIEFRALLSGEESEANYQALCDFEEAADEITRQTLKAIHHSFITPLDRSQILDLTTALDDTIDLMKETGRRLRLYTIDDTPEMLSMADCAVQATRAIHSAMPLLSAIGRNVDQLQSMQEQVRQAEGRADDLMSAGLQTLFTGTASAGTKLTVEKV